MAKYAISKENKKHESRFVAKSHSVISKNRDFLARIGRL